MAHPDRRLQILEALAGGGRQSGEQLAAGLGISRTAVWQHVKGLRDLGVSVSACRGQGYQLERPIELLDRQRILRQVRAQSRKRMGALDLFFETDSTNQRLLEAGPAEAIHGRVCVAEFQTAGRGRRGRRWVAPLGGSLCLSLAWRFDLAVMLAGLSLAIAVAVRRALLRLGATGIALKWPNDVVCDQRKLAGILIEVRGETGGPCTVVIGIGINVSIPPEAAAAIEQPCTDLQTVTGRPVSRNELAAELISELFESLPRYEAGGLIPFLQEWRQADATRGKRVELRLPNRRVLGRVVDIDDNGALLVNVNGTVDRFISGEISLRTAS